MKDQVAAVLLAALSLTAMWLIGRKHWSGWLVGLVSQGLLGYLTWGLWGVTALCATNAGLYAWTLRRWWREAE